VPSPLRHPNEEGKELNARASKVVGDDDTSPSAPTFSGLKICHVARDIKSTGGGEVVRQVALSMAQQRATVVLITDTPDVDLGHGVRVVNTAFGRKLLRWTPRSRAGWHARHTLQIVVFTLSSSALALAQRMSGAVIFNHNCESLVGDVLVMHNVFTAEHRRRRLNGWGNIRSFLHPVRFMRFTKELLLSRKIWHRHLVAVSAGGRTDVTTLAGGNGRVTVISNGVDLERFGDSALAPVPAVLTNWLQQDFNHVAVFIGHEYRRKGLDDLLEAMALLPPEYALVVVGGASQNKAKYVHAVSLLGVSNRVLFAGDHEDVRPFLSKASVFCLPSYYETMPLVALEALAAGVPIVLTAECPASELIRTGENGCVVSHEPGDIARGIVDVSRPHRTAEKRRLVQDAVAGFGWEAVATRYLELALEVSSRLPSLPRSGRSGWSGTT
jgi:glycosyltransferase involved in cell wall biosynthesis